MTGSPLRVLFMPREDPNWEWARSNPYSANWAWEEGLSANGIEFTTVPAFSNIPCSTAAWARTVRDVCGGRHFDQVWIEMIYSPFDEATLNWLASLAPVRVGLVGESLELSPEAVEHPSAAARSVVESRLPYISHLLLYDERDAEGLGQSGRAAAMWGPNAVPARYICDDPPPPKEHCAVFGGTLYGKRKQWLSRAQIKSPASALAPPEDATSYPLLFNQSNQAIMLDLLNGVPIPARQLPTYLGCVRTIRREIYGLWLAGLQVGSAVLNLPHYVKSYAGHVTEGMAAGRPVISWDIPYRPRNRALFEDEREILLFPQDDPSTCDDHIDRILNDPQHAARIAANARHKLRSFHTTEKRVEQILHWIETGDAPTYGAG